jgi:hypothetical protein
MSLGRPSRTAQIHIREKLRECFEYGLSATITAQKTKINIKTVCKYFDEWLEQITEQQTADFLENQKTERTRIIISFDKQILDVAESLSEINFEIKKNKDGGQSVPRYLLAFRLDMQKFIASLIERRGSFALQQPIDEKMKTIITDMVREHASKQSS